MTGHTPAGQQAGDFVGGYEHPAAGALAGRKAKYAGGVAPVSKYTGGETGETATTIKGGGGSSGGGGATGSWDTSAKVDSDFFKSRAGSEVSQTEGLNPEFADDLERATKAGEAATGQKASFTSLVRSKEKQAELYYNYIHGIGGQGLAAKPGTSLHERGMAADLAEGSTRDWVRAHAGDYGMELVPAIQSMFSWQRAVRR